tara:strand:- start:112 stop:684 length:573 start_codon:yes stop_codon:yes gene_type:complete
MPLERSYSDKYVEGMGEYDLYKNKNVEWMSGPGTKACYVLFVLLLWAFFHVTGMFDAEDCWTVTNVIHAVATLTFFHWMKGNPDDTSQGDYNGFTLYEQLDAGAAYTTTKKFLMIIPALLCWLSCHLKNYNKSDVVVNLGMFLLCIIPKVPEMHQVRLFGVNSTPGIDDPIEYNVPENASAKKSSRRKKA